MLVTPFLTCVSENPIAKLLQRVSRVFEVVDDKKGGEHGHDHGHTNRYYYHRALSRTQLRGNNSRTGHECMSDPVRL
jgi:hypothetical protein